AGRRRAATGPGCPAPGGGGRAPAAPPPRSRGRTTRRTTNPRCRARRPWGRAHRPPDTGAAGTGGRTAPMRARRPPHITVRARDRPSLFLPEALPPRRLGPRRDLWPHLLPDVGEIPPCQARELLGLARVPLHDRLAVLGDGTAAGGAGPCMTQHIAPLEVRPIAGFLEHEILGKVCAVVPDVDARHEHVGRLTIAAVAPEDAETPQL